VGMGTNEIAWISTRLCITNEETRDVRHLTPFKDGSGAGFASTSRDIASD
jgi:hypothetical protein